MSGCWFLLRRFCKSGKGSHQESPRHLWDFNWILFEVSSLQSKIFWHFVYFDLLDLLASVDKHNQMYCYCFYNLFHLILLQKSILSWNWHQGSARQQIFCSQASKTFVRRCKSSQNLGTVSSPSQTSIFLQLLDICHHQDLVYSQWGYL